MLGKDDAALLPSGTMAQQIALRIHCDRRGVSTVAFHPTCHLELHEHGGYAHLHGLKAELVGDRDRLIELEDLEGLHAPIGALLIELPQREIGGRLPEWDDLVRQIEWARGRNAATHLDGARIWESAPYYRASSRGDRRAVRQRIRVALQGTRRPCRQLARGPGGAHWPRRGCGGGDTAAPSSTCFRSLPRRSGASTSWWRRCRGFSEHARALGAALGEVPGVTVVPDPPQTPLFHVHLRGDRNAIWSERSASPRSSACGCSTGSQPSVLPGVNKLELNVGEPALEISPPEAAHLFATVVAG